MIRNIIAHYIASNAYTIRKPIRRAEVNATLWIGRLEGTEVRPQTSGTTFDDRPAHCPKFLIPSVLAS